MKVDRRSFLGLGLGALAGVAVSPVGVKLTDDSSIWSQNWPWTPVPVDGEITYQNSVCNLCPGGCGIRVRKIDGRPVKIEGLEGYPVNNGGACLHGMAGLQYLYDPVRVRTPLKQVDGRFYPISWQEAMGMAAEKLGALRSAGTPERLACISGYDHGSVPGLFRRFMTAFGSSNYCVMPGLENSLSLTARTLHGEGLTLGYDLDQADYILSFGAGLIDGWGSPVACFKTNADLKTRGAHLCQIEPRQSNTAAAATQWIPIVPGTEADLALALCGYLLDKNLFDPDPAGLRGGINRFHAMLQKEYAVDKVAGITGIPADIIQKTAESFAKARNPIAIPGRGKGNGSQSLKEFAAIQVLNCLTGNINQSGGTQIQPILSYLRFPEPVLDTIAQTGLGQEKISGSVQGLVEALQGSGNPALDALFVYNANPCHTLHAPSRVREAIEKVPFVVSFSSFMDETTRLSDLVLPVSIFLERTEDVPACAGQVTSVVGLARPVIPPVFHTRAPGDILIHLAQTMGGSLGDSFPWASYDECLEDVAGDIWSSLDRNGYVTVYNPPLWNVETDISLLADNPATIRPQGDGDVILVPVDDMRIAESVPASSPFAMKTVSDKVLSGSDTVVEINPATLPGAMDGDRVTLTTPAGTVRVKVSLCHGIMPGVIGMPRGLGHTLANPYLADKGVNVNDLISPVIEPESGLDAACCITARISRA